MTGRFCVVITSDHGVPESALAAVFARAAALDVDHGTGGADTAHGAAGRHEDGLDEDALVEIGAAVGLSPAAIRQAVAEHRAGALLAPAAPEETWVGARLAVVKRRVHGDQTRVRRSIERALDQQLLRKVRGGDGRSTWCPRTDVAARVARRLDLHHRLVLHNVSGLALTVVEGPGWVTVRFEADPAERRSGLGWVVAGAATGSATLGALLAVAAGLDPAVLAVVPAVGCAVAGGGGGVALARRSYAAEVRRLTDDLEGLLDRLSLRLAR